MRAKTDAATDVWMTEAADAAPGFWAHCWCRAFQLFLTNALWEFKGILIFRSPADDLVWTSDINSSRETAFKRSQTRWWSIKQQFSIETGADESAIHGWSRQSRMNAVYCFSWLTLLPLQSFATHRFHSCIIKNKDIFDSAVHSLSSLSFCWSTNGSNSQHRYHTRPHMLMVRYS